MLRGTEHCLGLAGGFVWNDVLQPEQGALNSNTFQKPYLAWLGLHDLSAPDAPWDMIRFVTGFCALNL